jgi:hypothetical protein
MRSFPARSSRAASSDIRRASLLPVAFLRGSRQSGYRGRVIVEPEESMRLLLLVVGWFILLAVSWPLALLVLLLAPILLLIAIPFLLLGVMVSALLALIKQVLFLPARILGHRG